MQEQNDKTQEQVLASIRELNEHLSNIRKSLRIMAEARALSALSQSYRTGQLNPDAIKTINALAVSLQQQTSERG